jgi:hypothetical protein
VCKTDNNAEIKWDSDSVTYYVNTSGGPSGALSAIQSAMETWTDVVTSDFTFVYGGTTSSTAHGQNDGTNIITSGPMGLNGVLAENYYFYITATGYMLSSDIKFNTDYPWSVSGSSNAYDVQNLGTHEFGHSLCLADLYGSSDSSKTMYNYASLGETKKRTPDADDINGIAYLYPSSCDNGCVINTMPSPVGQHSFQYPPAEFSLISIDPSQAKPIGVGCVATGENFINLHVGLGQFTEPIDIYFALYLPSLDPNIYLLTSDNNLQLLDSGIVRWKENVPNTIDEYIVRDIPVSLLPSGVYYFGLLATPAGGSLDGSFYLWLTYFKKM